MGGTPIALAGQVVPGERSGGGWLVLVGAGLLLVLVVVTLLPVAGPIAIGAMIASLADRPCGALARRLGGRRRTAAVLVTAGVTVAVLAPLAIVLYLTVGQAVDLVASFGRDPQVVHDGWEQVVTRRLHLPVSQLERLAGEAAQRVLPIVQALATKSFEFVLAMILLTGTLYALLADGRAWLAGMARIRPLGSPTARLLLEEFHNVSRAVILGSYLTALLHGAAGGLAFLLFGLPRALLWGAVMVVASLIPGIGTALVWGPAAVLLAAEGHWGRAIGLVAYGMLVMGSIDYFVRPALSHGPRMRLPEYGVFVSMLGGVAAFGFAGLFIGPMVLSLLLVAIFALSRAEDVSA